MTLCKWNRLAIVWVALSLLAAPGAQMVSVDRTGTNAGASSVDELYVVSGDGRYAAFSSSGTNYVANDTNGLSDIFVYDCAARSNAWNTCYSKAPAATLGTTFDSKPIHFTPDGRFLLFASRATNHVPGNVYPIGHSYQLYVRDLVSNVTHLVTAATDGMNGTANGADLQYFRHRLSSDGRFVVFVSSAANLVLGTNDLAPKIYCRDLLIQTTELINVPPPGLPSIGGGVWNFHTSTNARYIAFETMASNVISGFTNNGLPLTYWRDRVAGTTVLVGVTTNGARAFGSILLHSLSSDGRFVAFRSIDTNLTSDVIFHSDNFNLFIRDMFLGQTWTVNRHPAGHSTASFITGAQFSGDGNWLLYSSSDTDVLPGITDVNGSSPDLFIYYLPWRTNGLLSISFTGNQGAAGYVSDDFARLSSSGRFTLFTSFSTNLLPNTPDAAQRLFLRDQKAGLTRNAVPPAFPTPSFNAARHTITENERYIFFLSHVNFDPAVRKTDSAIELFRAPLYVPRLSLANSNIIVGEGLAGLSYVIESSTNLLHWTAISTNNADAHGVLIVKSRELSTGVPRFYRLLWP